MGLEIEFGWGLVVGVMPTKRGAPETVRDGCSGKEWTGVGKRDFDGVDDVSTLPITADESANPVKLLSSSLKLGGGAIGAVTGGCLQSSGGTGYGMMFLFERVIRRPWWMISCQMTSVMCM